VIIRQSSSEAEEPRTKSATAEGGSWDHQRRVQVSVELRLDSVCKSFEPPTLTLKDITFTVAPGECLALVGPSGCGKTTLLRVIAGLEPAASGEIAIDNQAVNDVPCHRRGVAMLFQRPALIPQQTVRRNMRWPWTLRRPLRSLFNADCVHEAQLLRVARLLELDQVLDRQVQQLSGGQQQRVALGRCLLGDAKICLLDEPLGHLDAPLRLQLRRQIRALMREFQMTAIHVTHDPEEALAVGDRVAVMQAGMIVQIDNPEKLRRFPANRFVAELVHHQDGGLNILNGSIVRDDVDVYFESGFGRWPMSLQILAALRESLYLGENFHASSGKVDITIGIAVRDVRSGADVCAGDDEVSLAMTVSDLECTAAGDWVIAANERGSWIGRAYGDERMERGQAVTMAFSMDRAFCFDSLTGRTFLAPP
jgi:ABC-type sugar transport system ATPase subunit